MAILWKKLLIFVKIADIPSTERPSQAIRITATLEEEPDQSSWEEASVAEEVAVSAEVASEAEVSEAVEPEAGFKVRTSFVILSIAKDLITSTLCTQILHYTSFRSE